MGLLWEKKSTFLRWTIIETDNGRNFISTKFSVIDFSLAKEEIFHLHGQNRPVTNLLVVDMVNALPYIY